MRHGMTFLFYYHSNFGNNACDSKQMFVLECDSFTILISSRNFISILIQISPAVLYDLSIADWIISASHSELVKITGFWP